MRGAIYESHPGRAWSGRSLIHTTREEDGGVFPAMEPTDGKGESRDNLHSDFIKTGRF